MKKKSKKWIWIIVVLLLVAACAVAAWFLIPRDSGEPVFVYGFMDGTAGITDYYDGMNQSDGMVTTDRIQTIYLSGTQNVKEILVYEGQEVKKGDVLFTYDTTLSDIELQRKDLSVQQLKLDLITAQQELAVINSYVPISYHPVETPEVEQPALPEVEISDLELEGKDFVAYSGKGDTSLTPKYCWLRSDAMVDELMMQALFLEHEGDSLFVIFQHTEEDSNEGAITEQFGLKIMRLGSAEDGEEVTYRFSFYDPAKVGQPEGPVDDGVDWNSGFTAAEIHQMRLAQMERIEDLEFQIKMAEAEYKIMQKEADNGQVLAEFDGIVIGVLDAESAQAMGEPLMRVSGGGGYYITGSVSELDLDTVELGQIVDIMSWDTGMSYEGTIIDIQQFPDESGNYYYYGSSQNVSYYPYTVFVGEEAMLQDGYWVSMTLRGAEGAGGLYINNAFVLTEGASSYVYVRGEDGLLEKRRRQFGGLLWGEYSLVTSGLTAEDYVAFPYGKDIREGAPTAEGTWEDLMGY